MLLTQQIASYYLYGVGYYTYLHHHTDSPTA